MFSSLNGYIFSELKIKKKISTRKFCTTKKKWITKRSEKHTHQVLINKHKKFFITKCIKTMKRKINDGI
jgi:hypothetical protein